jgi:hypothetical protein
LNSLGVGMTGCFAVGLALAMMAQNPVVRDRAELRTWYSDGNRYSIQASLEGSRYDAGSKKTLLLLKKADGSVVEVPEDRLSDKSRRLAARLLETHRSSGREPDRSPTEEKAPYFLPSRVEVLPVLLVPNGSSLPTDDLKLRLTKHLKWSQQRYRELLRGQDTFQIAKDEPVVFQAAKSLVFYRGLQGPETANQWMAELLAHYRVNRLNCPYVFLIVIVNPDDGFPTGGGRPINGGFNTGGGIVILSSYDLDHGPNFQSTLQHELGHSFGLPHVDVYGYDMKTNPSLMSYNQSHHTKGFDPSDTPAVMVPEDVRGLALNRRVFGKLQFDPATNVPAGYSMCPRVVWLGPMNIPGQEDYHIAVTTDSGETFGSKVQSVVLREIKPNRGPGITYDANNMWTSGTARDGWVSLELTFPMAVQLDRIAIHSQHSGQYHAAHAVGIQAMTGNTYRNLIIQPMRAADGSVSFRPTEAQKWKLQFRCGPSGQVVIRGLQFFLGETELFPPLVPYTENR